MFVILALSIALAAPSISGLSRLKAKSTARRVAVTFRYATALAMRSKENCYVRITGNRITLSGQKTGLKKEIPVPEDVTAGPAGTIVFYPWGGSSGGAFEVRDRRTKNYFIIKAAPSTGEVSVAHVPAHGDE